MVNPDLGWVIQVNSQSYPKTNHFTAHCTFLRRYLSPKDDLVMQQESWFILLLCHWLRHTSSYNVSGSCAATSPPRVLPSYFVSGRSGSANNKWLRRRPAANTAFFFFHSSSIMCLKCGLQACRALASQRPRRQQRSVQATKERAHTSGRSKEEPCRHRPSCSCRLLRPVPGEWRGDIVKANLRLSWSFSLTTRCSYVISSSIYGMCVPVSSETLTYRTHTYSRLSSGMRYENEEIKPLTVFEV